ncbi:hypothetical protein [Sinorhizobium fredii]
MTQNEPTDPEPTLPPAVIACAIIGAVVLVATSLNENKSFGTWLYDYQTLITGVLAVIAAVATIWQMRASDALQERHAFRGDIIAVKRLRAFLPGAAREYADNLRPYAGDENSPNPFDRAYNWIQAQHAVERLQDALQGYRVTSCFHLLPSEIFELLEDCKREVESISKLERAREELDLQDPRARERDELYVSTEMERMGKLGAKAAQLASLVDKWAEDFLVETERSHTSHLTP